MTDNSDGPTNDNPLPSAANRSGRALDSFLNETWLTKPTTAREILEAERRRLLPAACKLPAPPTTQDHAAAVRATPVDT